MNRVTRDSFVASGNSLDLRDLDATDAAALAQAGLDPAALARIAGADGVIAGKAELTRLFAQIDRLDRDGSYASLAPTTKNEEGREVLTASGHALTVLQDEIAEARLKHQLGGPMATKPAHKAGGAADVDTGGHPPAAKGARPNDPYWLKNAFGEMGVEEIKGPEANKRILEYFEHTYQKGKHVNDSTRDDAWCAAFVTFTLDVNGGEAKVKHNKAVGAREYQNWGEPSEPFPGAIVVLQKGTQKHVAILAGVDENGNNVYLGGNQRNKVSLSHLEGYEVIAVRKPKGYEIPAGLKALPRTEPTDRGPVTTR